MKICSMRAEFFHAGGRKDGPTDRHTGMMNYESLFSLSRTGLQTACPKVTDAQTATLILRHVCPNKY
jgi:hypothetical protein